MTHIVLGTLTLDGGIVCNDWADLLQSPPKRGQNRLVPGQAGRVVRPRVMDEMRAALPVRLKGWLNVDGTLYAGDPHDNVYALWDVLRGVCDVTVPQTLQLVTGAGTFTGECVVEELTAPKFETPTLAAAVIDVTFAGGPLDFTPPAP
jgi:hypothetical protein